MSQHLKLNVNGTNTLYGTILTLKNPVVIESSLFSLRVTTSNLSLDMTVQQECSLFPLVEMECTISPPICWLQLVNLDNLT